VAPAGTNLLLEPVYETVGKDADAAAADVEAAQKDSEFGTARTGGAYCLRVLIPCYKEPFDIVHRTIVAARDAVLPAGEDRG
jgi:hypothetical protein